MLLPCLEANFRAYVERGELPGGRGSFPQAHRPWLHPEKLRRHDIRLATDDERCVLTRAHLLDRYRPDTVFIE